ncbi:MAG: hypothetical protein RLZZ436_3918 [Planctomycetota bacterium]|jgi:hypothetical protein
MPESTIEFTDRERRRLIRRRRTAEVLRSSRIERQTAAAESRSDEEPTSTNRSLRYDEGTESREIIERRRQDRRRQIDPTTCERDYSSPEVEFMRAMDDYKRRSGRPFPTWSEVLEVVVSLGYRKVAEPTTMAWRTHGDTLRDESSR